MIFKTNFKFSKVFIGFASAAALTGCLSDYDAPAAKTTIVGVMDPYAIGCTVTGANGYAATAIDATASPGRYQFSSTINVGEITAAGCTDLATSKPLPTFKAPAPTTLDESVVTPITTVITAMMSSGLTASEAEAAISQDFPGIIDLLTFDPFTCLDKCQGILVQSFSNRLTVAIVMLQAAVEDDAAVITALADAYASGGTINMNAIVEAAHVPVDVSTSIATVISNINNKIEAAASTISAGSTPAEITTALKTMTAGVIVASNLVTKVEAAVASDGNADDLDSSISNLASLISDAEVLVNVEGFISAPVPTKD